MNETARCVRQAGRVFSLGVLLGLAGCVTSSVHRTGEVDLTLTSAGTLVLDGAVIRRSDLPRALRAVGAGPATPIVVSTAADTPMVAISALTSQLATAGHRCVVFKRPRHADARTVAPTIR